MPNHKQHSDHMLDMKGYRGNLGEPNEAVSPLASRGDYKAGLYAPSEFRAMYLKYTDPLALNFRLMINVNSTVGFFGGAWMFVGKNPLQAWNEIKGMNSEVKTKCPNSAVSYLARIGDMYRVMMWVTWINDLVDLVRNWDFLQESVEGLDQIIQAQEHAAWVDAHFSITFRENVTSRVQRIITDYRAIWWDFKRGVEVLPKNLRAMDISILVFNAGYWGGKYALSKEEYTKKYGKGNDWNMFPTIEKMQKLDPTQHASKKSTYQFIYHLFHFPSAYYNYDSGVDYFSEVTNLTSSEPLHTKMVFDFFSVEYTSSFKKKGSVFEAFNEVVQTGMAIQDTKTIEEVLKQTQFGEYLDSWKDAVNESLNDIAKGVTDPFNEVVGGLYNSIKGTVTSTLNKWATAPQNWLKETAKGWGAQINNWMTNVLKNNSMYHFLNANFGPEAAGQVTQAMQSGVKAGVKLDQIQNELSSGSSVNQEIRHLTSRTQTGGVRLFGNEEPLFPQSQIDTQTVNSDMSNMPEQQRSLRSQQSSITPPQDQLQGIRQDDIKFGQSQIDTHKHGSPTNEPQSQLTLNKQGSMSQGSIEQSGGSQSGDEKLNPNRQIATRKGF